MKLSKLLKQDFKKPPMYSTGIKPIDSLLEGGFELGQLIAITGDSEAGKTKLVEQILTYVALKHKCLYFALEFNIYQVFKYFIRKLDNKDITKTQTENIEIITSDEIDGEINTLISIINNYIVKENITFVVIDSAINLYHNDLNGEQETTEIFRLLQKTAIEKNIILLVIAQSSKEENKESKIGIFGSQKAKHFVNMLLHIHFDEKSGERKIKFAKNKQNGAREIIDLYFDQTTLTFVPQTKKNKKTLPKTQKQKKSLWDVMR